MAAKTVACWRCGARVAALDDGTPAAHDDKPGRRCIRIPNQANLSRRAMGL